MKRIVKVYVLQLIISIEEKCERCVAYLKNKYKFDMKEIHELFR